MIEKNKMQHVYIIAEVGVNHNGDKEIGKKLIDLAGNAGADAVKFQMFYPELLCSSVYRRDEIEMLKKYMVSVETMKEFREYAHKKHLDFIVTPFDFKSLEDVIALDCSSIKIGSGELTHIPFLQQVANSKKPIILSTGAAYLSDVERAVLEIKKHTTEPLALLHCVSTYPAPDEYLNLRAITTLKQAFPNCEIGYSDHSLGLTAANIAVTLGASIIEKHITLDKTLPGPDHTASADSYEFIEMVKSIRQAEKMLGDGFKCPQSCETIIGRSIVASRDLKIGEILTEDLIDYKRPGRGLRPYELTRILGARLTQDINKDELITLEHMIIRGDEIYEEK